MAIQIQKIEPHWNYLLALERSIDEVSRYIEFDEGNFECFSIEIARILLACGAEVDVVCKQICRSISSTSDANNINMYRDEIGSFFSISGYPLYSSGEPSYPWTRAVGGEDRGN